MDCGMWRDVVGWKGRCVKMGLAWMGWGRVGSGGTGRDGTAWGGMTWGGMAWHGAGWGLNEIESNGDEWGLTWDSIRSARRGHDLH